MTGKDLLLILGEINPQYYEEGEYQTIGDETHPRPAVRTLLIAALIALILAVPGCAKFLFSPLNGDELSLGGTYRGNGIVTVEVKNGSDKELKFQKQLKLMCWETSEEVEKQGGEVVFQNTEFAPHTEGTMVVDISAAYDVAALEQSSELHYFILTNNDFLFGHDWMCSFRFREPEETEPTQPPTEPDPALGVSQSIADIEEELRFYFELAYPVRDDQQNALYSRKVAQLLQEFTGNVISPVDPGLIVGPSPADVVFDETFPKELQYQLVGEHYTSLDGYGRMVGAKANGIGDTDLCLKLEALLPQYPGQTDGGVGMPLLYLFTYETPMTMEKDNYAFIYGRVMTFEELKGYKVYEDQQYTVYEVTDLFYTDLDAYLDYFLTTRTDIYSDEQVRQRIRNIYDYYKVKENLTNAFYYNLP